MNNELKRSGELTSAVKMATSGLGILVSNFLQFNCNLLTLNSIYIRLIDHRIAGN